MDALRDAPGSATVQRYGEALQWVIRDIGDQPVTGLHMGHLLTLRRKMEVRGCREARIAAILHGLRAFLKFCREVVRVPTLSSREFRVPRPGVDGVYLTREEVSSLGGCDHSPDVVGRGAAHPAALSGTGGGAPRYRGQDFRSLVTQSQRYPPRAQRGQDRGKGNKDACSILPIGRSCGWSGISPGGGMMTTRFL